MNVTFGEAIFLFYKKWRDFDGCATRAEYWYPALYMFVVGVVFGLFGKTGDVLAGVFSLINIIPGIAVGIRRMHDIGKSGWWILISLIPIIGWIWGIILLATPTKEIGNPYKA